MPQSIVKVDELQSKLAELKSVLAPKATDSELKLFAIYCQKTQLDPFSGQIHFVKRGDRAMFQTSIDGYRAIAERTGMYAGSSDPIFDEGLNQFEHIKAKRGFPTTASVTVLKIVGGQTFEIKATAEWSAYCPSAGSDFMWKKMPYLMLGKVAEALALRKAFPNAFSGLYVDEELEQAREMKKVEVAEEKFVEIKEGTKTGEALDLFTEFKTRLLGAKNKETATLVVEDIREAAKMELLSEAEVDELRKIFKEAHNGESK